MSKQKTVKDMYSWARQNNVNLLSDFNADFWQDYLKSPAEYDHIFTRMFRSFRYFLQEEGDDISLITTEFINDVKGVLTMNAKRYGELYQINVLSNDAYDIVNNYDIDERENTKVVGTNTDTFGARSDSTDDSTMEHQDTVNTTVGAVTDTLNVGEQISSDKNDIAGFNSSNYSDADLLTRTNGARIDSTNTSEQNNTEIRNYGKQDNLRTFDKGEQHDSHSNTNTVERTFVRTGNIGVKSAPQILGEHVEFWSVWQFYEMIFKDISKELLLVSDSATDFFECY